MVKYIPKRGDFIYLNFNPQAGHEQMGKRPALVISHTAFNKRMGFAFVCPISNTKR
ncbi:potassium-transporting ATPase subunit C [Candidatus Magnetomorum sp. HK-1]|nr:potassium-transporting ATPase subunit C [Candidatus Magnetomorum sp. HK-1]